MPPIPPFSRSPTKRSIPHVPVALSSVAARSLCISDEQSWLHNTPTICRSQCQFLTLIFKQQWSGVSERSSRCGPWLDLFMSVHLLSSCWSCGTLACRKDPSQAYRRRARLCMAAYEIANMFEMSGRSGHHRNPLPSLPALYDSCWAGALGVWPLLRARRQPTGYDRTPVCDSMFRSWSVGSCVCSLLNVALLGAPCCGGTVSKPGWFHRR